MEIDLSIARGLDYYTGTIYETFLTDIEGLGAVMSGGRYDELLDMFGQPQVPSVGISLGIDRLFSALTESGRLTLEKSPTRVLVTVFNESLRAQSYDIANQLRRANVPTEIYPSVARMKKQLQYANRQDVEFVLFLGTDEVKANAVKVKDMRTGTESLVSVTDLIDQLAPS